MIVVFSYINLCVINIIFNFFCMLHLLYVIITALLYCENSHMPVCIAASIYDIFLMCSYVYLCTQGRPGPQTGGGGVRSEHQGRRSAFQRQLRSHPPEQAGRHLPQGVSAYRYRTSPFPDT